MLHAASSYSLDIGVELIANITTHKASMNLGMGLAKKEVVMSQNPIMFLERKDSGSMGKEPTGLMQGIARSRI